MSDEADLLAANEAFYAAFRARSMEARHADGQFEGRDVSETRVQEQQALAKDGGVGVNSTGSA